MKICFITSTRADYGILKPLMDKFKESEHARLQIIVTGSHLSSEHGMTIKEIIRDNFEVNEQVEILTDDDKPIGISRSAGLAVSGVAEALKSLDPNLVVLLGDRYEILSAAIACAIQKIPVAHLHGGELTEGAMDEMFRHAISKLSHLHFTSTDVYRNRVIQLGESPDRVWNVGGLGVANALSVKKLDKKELYNTLKIPMDKRLFLITYHPETLSAMPVKKQIDTVLEALEGLENVFLLFTKANADPNGKVINNQIAKFVESHPEISVLYDSLGYLRYLNLVGHAELVLGNSSSGIIEVPSFGVPTINIGNRQKGRIASKCVVHVACDTKQIRQAIKKVEDSTFRSLCQTSKNPYEGDNTADEIYNAIMKSLEQGITVRKAFYDIM